MVLDSLPDLGFCEVGVRRLSSKSSYSHQFRTRPRVDGKEPDHLCGNRWCINLYHLDDVEHSVNIKRSFGEMRSDTCQYGHPYSYRVRLDRNGEHERYCKECNRLRTVRGYLKK